MPASPPSRFPAALAASLLALAACRADAPATGVYAARVGEATLSEADVAVAVAARPPDLDSAAARRQAVEQWVTAELLAQEARRQGLAERPDVARALAAAERDALGTALVERFFEANPGDGDAELAAYYARERERLALREPYVRVRHLRARTAADAESARAALARAGTEPHADSLWRAVVAAYADDTDGALALSASLVPESRLADADAPLGARVAALQPGGVTPVVASGSAFAVAQLVERVPAGIIPPLEWVREELGEQLALEQRQALLARQVQSLRARAQADGRLSF